MRSPVRLLAALAAIVVSVGPAAWAGPTAGPVQPPASQAPVRVLSLDEAVREALRENPTLDEAQAAIRRAEAVAAEARSFTLPRLDGDATFTLQGPIPSFRFPVPSTDPKEPPRTQEITFGRTFTRSFAATATYDPDPFGRLRASRTAAERQVNVARGGLYLTQNELVYAVQNVYLSALRSRELVEVAREAVEAAREQLRVAEAQFRAGTSPEFDVLRARVQVANLRQNIVTADADFRRALATLARLTGQEPQTRLELAPVALPPEPDRIAAAAARVVVDGGPGFLPDRPLALSRVPGSLETALEEAFTRRPEVYRAEWARRAAEARVEAERKGNLPRVNVSAGYQFNPDQTGFAFETHTWSLIANVTVPIWDAGLSRARTRQARADVAAAAAQLESARDVVAEDVKRALLDLEDATERRRAAAANTIQAREALRIARVRYTAGLAPNVEVTDAEAALTQARSNEVNAAYDYVAALAALNRALGRYAGEALIALQPAPR
jgi:outer membrane protein TolC